MPDVPEVSSTLKAFNLEPLAKGVTLFATLGLGAGLLYDAVFFWIIEAKLARLLVMSDHIETAISTLPLIGLVALTQFGGFYFGVLTASGYFSRRRWLQWLLIAGMIVPCLAYLGSRLILLPWWYTLIIVAICVMTFGLFLFVPHALLPRTSSDPSASTSSNATTSAPTSPFKATLKGVSFLVVFVVVLTVAAAVLRGVVLLDSMKKGQATAMKDSIWFTDMSSINGEIVRVIDRGVILAVRTPTPEFLFIPKDQIKRVAFGW